MTDGHKIKLNKMIGFPAAAKDDKLVYRSAEKAEAMKALKEALSRPADDPRRMGNMQDAIYILTHGEDPLSDAEVQKEVDAFLREKEQQQEAQKKASADTLADMFKQRAAKTAPAATKHPQRRPSMYPR